MEVSNPEGYVLLYSCNEAADLVVYIFYSIRAWKKCATEVVSVIAFWYSFPSVTYVGNTNNNVQRNAWV